MMKVVVEVADNTVMKLFEDTRGKRRTSSPRMVIRTLAQDIVDRFLSPEHFSADGKDYRRLLYP